MHLPAFAGSQSKGNTCVTVVLILLVVATAASGAVFKPGAWYESLDKPAWTPPKIAFPIVWTSLYVLIAFAGWLVWREAGFGLALLLWLMQLAANALWSALFFGLHRMALALADAIAMWLLVAAFIVVAWPISAVAAILFVPYLIWLSLAVALNWSILTRNPAAGAP